MVNWIRKEVKTEVFFSQKRKKTHNAKNDEPMINANPNHSTSKKGS